MEDARPPRKPPTDRDTPRTIGEMGTRGSNTVQVQLPPNMGPLPPWLLNKLKSEELKNNIFVHDNHFVHLFDPSPAIEHPKAARHDSPKTAMLLFIRNDNTPAHAKEKMDYLRNNFREIDQHWECTPAEKRDEFWWKWHEYRNGFRYLVELYNKSSENKNLFL